MIYWNESELESLPAPELNRLNAAHLDFNDELRRTGHLVEAEALQPSRTAACVRVRRGKVSVTDGPFTEAKELVAGFYLIEARDMDDAIRIAARFPSAPRTTIEVRPIHQLVVEGRPPTPPR